MRLGQKPIRSLSKGMAQTVQLLGTLIHKPRLIILDEPFAGLDAINQARLEELIRRQARDGRRRSSFRPTSSRTPSGCASESLLSRTGKVAFEGRVDDARDTAAPDRPSSDPRRGRAVARRPSRAARGASAANGCSSFPSGPEPLLKALIDGGAGIETLAIERPGLHDAFVAIAGNAAADAMGAGEAANDALPPLAPSSLPAAISPPPCCRRPSSSSCLGRCSRCSFGGVFGSIGATVASQTERPVVAVIGPQADFDRWPRPASNWPRRSATARSSASSATRRRRLFGAAEEVAAIAEAAGPRGARPAASTTRT